MTSEEKKLPNISLEDNLKKALTELLLLHLFFQRPYYIGDLINAIAEKSGDRLKLVFPYSAVYRLQKAGLIVESEKRVAPDGRRRQYFKITKLGRKHYWQLREVYENFSQGVTQILDQW